jgi:predicted phage terminase large subunit-like protein
MDDLAGRLMEASKSGEGDHWKVLNFPALAEHDDGYRRTGEALHPERYDLGQLGRIKKAIGTRDWNALYQQRPVPDGGLIFRREWIRTWTRLPTAFDETIASWDMAFKGKSGSDFVVGQAWGRRGGDFYLLDQVRGRWTFTQTLEAVTNFSTRWPEAVAKLIEDTANGPAVIDSLKSRITGIIPVNPEGGKVARAYAVSPAWESGNVYMPDRAMAEWADDFEAELLQFPMGANDDQVDAMTQALNRLINANATKTEVSTAGLRSEGGSHWGRYLI